ncbi:transposase [Actinomadura kijaniata]|uniref:transposase n=1 Tax=Actinomadura kijaniata TaxID=46161 RepID=UPI003F1B640E
MPESASGVAAPALGTAEPAAGGRSVGARRCSHQQFPRSGAQKGDQVGPCLVDCVRPGSTHHLIVDAHGVSLVAVFTGGHRHDVTQMLPLLDQIPSIPGRRGRVRRKLRRLHADRGYDHDKYPLLRSVASPRSSPAAAPHTVGDRAERDRWSSATAPGCASPNACASAPRFALTCTRPCWGWPTLSSVVPSVLAPHSEPVLRELRHPACGGPASVLCLMDDLGLL